jgi:hypothetical protein
MADDLFDERLQLKVTGLSDWKHTHPKLLAQQYPDRGWTTCKVVELFRFWRKFDGRGIEKDTPDLNDRIAIFFPRDHWFKGSQAGYYVGDIRSFGPRRKSAPLEGIIKCFVKWCDAPRQNDSEEAKAEQQKYAEGKYTLDFDPHEHVFLILNDWENAWELMLEFCKEGKAERAELTPEQAAQQEEDQQDGCDMCWASGQAGEVILCDEEGCTKGFLPESCGLDAVPEADPWYCPTCRPQDFPNLPAYTRQKLIENGFMEAPKKRSSTGRRMSRLTLFEYYDEVDDDSPRRNKIKSASGCAKKKEKKERRR